MPLSIGHYLNNMSRLTNQWTSQNYREPDRQRIYLKDIDCPNLWHDKLRECIPPNIFYLNDSTGDVGGPGSLNAHEKGIARCGDLMSCLPPDMRAENMMCYIGHEGTYTPAHREMCASLGQNLMVESSGMKDDEGNTTKPGSSIWFMTETKDRHLVSEYWLSTLGHDIEVEKHFAQLAAWKGAPFTTYIVEQKVGDFILVPPLAPHQVWNRGTRTMKVAWNRTTVETLEMALHEALPRARMVCRDEQYKNKAMIYFTLHKYSDLLNQADLQMRSARNPRMLDGLRYSTKIRQLQKDFKRLFALYTEILLSEMLSPVSPSEKRGQYLPFESFVTCSYCRCNIFNRFLTCTTCIAPLPNGEEDTYDVCMDCFAMGRSCSCISAYKWVEQFPWQDLIEMHELWRQLIINYEGGPNERSPKSLQAERKILKKKTLAQVCQEQLKIRPWSDPKNPLQALTHSQRREIGRTPTKETNADEDLDGDGHPKKRAKRRDYMDKNFLVEHVSLYPEEKWKLATCSKCDRSYSYGSLWRMFDLKPVTVMEDPEWQCPFCLKICSCGSCRKRGVMKPYEPKGTVLGHDTKAIADRRSMEHLVDFSQSNMRWITAVGDNDPIDSRRLNRRIEEAEISKSHDPTLDDNYIDAADDGLFVEDTLSTGPDIPIDPMLDPALLSTGQGSQAGSRFAAVNKSSFVTNSSSLPLDPSNTQNGTSVHNSSKSLRPAIDSALGIAIEDHPTSFISNGITYEYPDPTESQTMPNLSRSNQSDHTQARKSTTKRKSDLNLIQTDLVSEAPDAQAGQSNMSQNQLQQSLQEARENDRYTITEAAITGKSLVVTLPLSTSRLAAISDSQPSTNNAISHISAAKELVQSDLLNSNGHTQNASAKKRKARSEKDDDTEFRIRQRRDRASASGMSGPNHVRSSRASYAEADTSSGEEDVVMKDPEDTSINKPQGPRPLPRYLAQRSEGQDLPDELPLEEPRRKSLPNMQKEHSVQTKSGPAIPELGRVSGATGKPRGRPPKGDFRQPMSESLAEANRRAKTKAVSWANDNHQESSSSEKSTSEDESPRPVRNSGKLMAVPMSLIDRKKLAGKKFKVTSAKAAGIDSQSKPSPRRGAHAKV